MSRKPCLNCPCEKKFLSLDYCFDAPPKGETHFNLNGQKYYRSYLKCNICSHWFEEMSIDMDNLYDEAYVDTVYGEKLLSTFKKIINLPQDQSDNFHRFREIKSFAESYFNDTEKLPSLLDVGSGLGVFPWIVSKEGWNCTALDPDNRTTKHIEEYVGCNTITGQFLDIAMTERYDIITFNKVLEHVYEPVPMLKKCHELLKPGGFVYVELPDGECAAKKGMPREEFFIEHLHVFSLQSTILLAERAGFMMYKIFRTHEPSDKYSLRAFLVPKISN